MPEGYIWDPDLQLGPETAALSRALWPNYLVEDSDLTEPELSFEITREELARRFPLWGIRHAESNRLVAYLNGVLIHADLETDQLPNQGWRYAIESVFSKLEPNCLCLIVAIVEPQSRTLGLAERLLEKAKRLTRDSGYAAMIAPVRPSLKHQFPQISMSDYIAKRSETGECFDPWLRAHIRHGGEVMNVCSESVVIRASFERWKEWLGRDFSANDLCIPTGGLVPLEIDRAARVAIYRESNIWVKYRIG